MPESKVSYVSEVLDGKVSRSDTCEIVLKQKWGNETPYTTHSVQLYPTII